ncbi:PEP-CTERM sorting domain-containing protein [Desulfobacter curvatus]|uniref:PEP-CTERM sorting domain-containing protein n=1 Tax=Desulfobacter curvatus TaxID=2290 RepID=UPI0003618E78|nr:PEP-CTERM sorting domain-containing protein [Desulfobacter curvatus]
MKHLKIFCLCLSVWIFLAGIALATTITAVATDIENTTLNQDLWEYEFTVSGYDYNTEDGFTIYFDYNSFGAIDPDGVVAAPNSDWDIQTWNPDTSLPDDGGYDAFALSDDYASFTETFTVQAVLLSNGNTTAWYYETYEAGQWDTVPEPTTALLLGIGLIGAAGALRKRE